MLNVQSQIHVISFVPGKLLSGDSFQKFNFCVSLFTAKYSDLLILPGNFDQSCNIWIFEDQ